jgi:hypothetical protein
VTIEEANMEFHLEVEAVIDELCETYGVSDAVFWENEQLLTKIKKYVQDIISYDELIEWVEELHETPTMLDEQEETDTPW